MNNNNGNNNKSNNKINMNVKGMSYGGISVALIMIIMYLSSIVRTNSLSVLFISSVIVCLMIVKFGVKYGLLTYVSTTLLSLLLIPDKFLGIAFLGLFGIYPIIKLYIERLDNLFIESILKLSFPVVSITLLYFILSKLVSDFDIIAKEEFIHRTYFYIGNIILGNTENIVLIIIALLFAIFMFFFYDILLSKVIYYIYRRLKIQ